jgi:uncharacterized transporter YbjL
VLEFLGGLELNGLRLLFLLFLVAFGLAYGSALKSVLDTNWLLFGVIAIAVPVGLAWIVGDEADRADFYKIRDWITGRLKRTQKPPLEPHGSDGQSSK